MKKSNWQIFKEVWEVPRYKALIKLGLYVIFFVFVFIFININKKENQDQTYTEKTSLEKYKEMTSYEYNYSINYIENGDLNAIEISGTKYNDTNEFKYLKELYFINNNIIYLKKTNEVVQNLINFNIVNLEPINIINYISNIEGQVVTSKVTKYSDDSSKTEYTIVYDDYVIYINIFEDNDYIYKLELDVTEEMQKANSKITDYNIEINYSNINNISSYDNY